MIEQIRESFRMLAEEIYSQGYMAGISDEKYFDAYAIAMTQIANGVKYDDEMVDKIRGSL